MNHTDEISFWGDSMDETAQRRNPQASTPFEPGVDLLDVGERAVFPAVLIQFRCAAARVSGGVPVPLWSAASTTMQATPTSSVDRMFLTVSIVSSYASAA